jgi:nitrilase
MFADLATTEWINPGDSVVVRPGGEVIAGPLHEQHGILYADLDVARATSDRRTLDVVGHYARNDVFGFTVDRTAREPSTPT